MGITILFNTCFLEKIYINTKQKEIEAFYEKLSKEDITEDEIREISHESLVKNIKFFVTDKDFYPIYYSFEKTGFSGEEEYIEDIKNFRMEELEENEEIENIIEEQNPPPEKKSEEFKKFEQEFKNRENLPEIPTTSITENKRINTEVIKETPCYIIIKTTERGSNLKKLELRTINGENKNIIINTSLDNISETVSIFNKISIVIIFIGSILGILISILISKKISKPIKKLSKISEKMSNLDFSEKYEMKANNEIDILGKNFNSMSNKLEETINSLNETNKELEKDIILLEKVDEKRKEFITNISHELKTPIAIIQGYGEAIHDGIAETKEEYEEYSGLIIDESIKMNKIVLQLIELMKSEEIAPQMEECNLELIANNIISVYKREDIKFNLKISGNTNLISDSFRLERALTNYITNAISHLDEENKEINVEIKEIDKDIEVKVFNYGKPIPEESINYLWDRFYKVDKARTRKYGGTGIGLSIVKSNIESLDGKVFVENKDKGVEFSFIIPKNL